MTQGTEQSIDGNASDGIPGAPADDEVLDGGGSGAEPGEQRDEGADDEATEGEAADGQSTDGVIEVDIDGAMVRGTREQIEALKANQLRQKDYTQKTQKTAEERRAIEAKAADIEAKAAHLELVSAFQSKQAEILGHISYMDSAIAEIAQVDIDRLLAENPAEAVRMINKRQQMELAKGRAGEVLQQKLQEFNHQQSQFAMTQAKKLQVELEKEVPGFNEQMKSDLLQYAINTGWTADDLNSIRSPKVLKLLKEKRDAEAKVRETRPKPPVQGKPVTTLSGSKARASVNEDDLPFKEYLALERERAAKKRY